MMCVVQLTTKTEFDALPYQDGAEFRTKWILIGFNALVKELKRINGDLPLSAKVPIPIAPLAKVFPQFDKVFRLGT